MVERELKCEVCKSTDMVTVLDLGMHALCDDLLPIGSQDRCEKFHIEIALCRTCLTAHQLHPVPKTRLFPVSYHYRSSLTQDVLNGMRGLVGRMKSAYGSLSGKTVLDVGCNDGSLLKFFRAEGALVYGVEPTAAAEDAKSAGIRVFDGFFDSVLAEKILQEIGNPDFITFTNVFAHIENLDELLASVMTLMGGTTRLVVENHYLGAVLEKYQFDTFYHEHPRTYSATSFVHIARRLNRAVELVEFPSRYGGNIRVVIGPGGRNELLQPSIAPLLQIERDIIGRFEEMRVVIANWTASRAALLARARSSDGKVYAKAFPGRAAILLQMLNLTEHDVAAVFEQPNSMKIGHYVPGTRIPIVSDHELLDRVPVPRRVLNLAWHIGTEIRTYLKGLDENIECVDVFSSEQFKGA